jgi:hypothetical protein
MFSAWVDSNDAVMKFEGRVGNKYSSRKALEDEMGLGSFRIHLSRLRRINY